jgi:hypothetical protein
MKNLVLTITLCLLVVATITAQRDRTILGSVDLSGAWGGTQIALTNFNGELAALRGGFGGVELNKNLFIGGGAYTSNTYSGLNDLSDTYEMSYGGLIVGYGYKSHKIIHPQATLMLGGGWMQEDGVGRDDVFVAQPAIGVEINVLRWFRVGVHGGYRVALGDSFQVDDRFSDVYGSVSLKFGWSWGR